MRRHKGCRNLGRRKGMQASGSGLGQTGKIFFGHHPATLAGEKVSPRSKTFCRN
jgi:hypothetical protein